jgi:hypothetical protein
VILILDHEPHDVLQTLQQVRGFALWRVASQLRGQFEQIDFLTVSCVALLLAVCRTTLAFARPSVAHGVADSHPSLTKTLSELGLLISIQMLLVPTTQDSSQSMPQHLLRILCIDTAASRKGPLGTDQVMVARCSAVDAEGLSWTRRQFV